MSRAATLLFATSAMLAGCSPAPCESCAAIGGHYSETVHSANLDCGDGHYLAIGNIQDSATVVQTGSDLRLATLAGMTGVLHADGSASFGPVPATAEPVDADGNPDPTGTPTPGRLFLNGFFTATPPFEGTYFFVADSDGCQVDARTQWSK